MAEVVLYFADPSDPTGATVGVDLNGRAHGDAAGFRITSLDWGNIGHTYTWSADGEAAGADQVRRHADVVEARIELLAEYDSTDDYEELLTSYRTLGQYLERHSVLVWQPKDESTPLFIDTYPSDIAAMFRGGEKDGLLLLEYLTDGGYIFPVWRHPYPRQESVTAADGVAITNTPGSNVVTFTNPGTAESEARIEIQVPGSEWVTQARLGIHDGDWDTDFAGFDVTGSTSLEQYWTQVHKEVITPATPSELAGTYRVLVSATLDEDIFYLQCRWGSTTSDAPQANTNEEVRLDAADLNNFPRVEVDLGLVTFDSEHDDLVIELWAKSVSGIDVGGWGHIFLIPADEQHAIASSPGYRVGAFGAEKFFPSEDMDHNVEVSDEGAAILEEDDHYAEVLPVAGRTLPVGPHVLAFRGYARNPDREKQKLGELRVLKNGSEERRAGIFAKFGQPMTRYTDDDILEVHFQVDDDSDLWRFRVEKTDSDTDTRIGVAALRHRFIPPITNNRSLVLDSRRREAVIVDGSGDALAGARTTALVRVGPGESSIAICLGEVAPAAWAAVDERMPLPISDPDTAASVTVTITPRQLHP